MGFRLEITKKRTAEGAEMEYVSRESITLADALQMIVFMFSSRGRREVIVTDFGPEGLATYFATYVGFLGDKPIVLPDQIPGYSGGFGYRFEPLSGEDYYQLIEMVMAYLIAYPDLGSNKVNDSIEKIKSRLAA